MFFYRGNMQADLLTPFKKLEAPGIDRTRLTGKHYDVVLIHISNFIR